MRHLFKRSDLPGWVGCVPQGTRARFAYVERRPEHRPIVHWVAEEDWSNAASTLRQLRRQRQLTHHRLVGLLERGQYQVVPIEAPEVPREEWKQALRWQVKDLVGFAADDAAIDLFEVPQTGAARARLLAVAAPQVEVDRLARPARDAGVSIRAVDIPESALRNIGSLVEPADRAQAILHIDAHGLLVISVGGELMQARAIELSAQQVAMAGDDPARARAFERAGLELQRTLDSFERQYSQLTMARLVVVPTPGSAALCAFLGELLYVPVEELDTGESLDLSGVPELADPAAFGPWSLAIGAALREA